MGRFYLSPEAVDDLELIKGYIQQDNPDAADRVIEAAYRLCKLLAEHPEVGKLRRFSSAEFADIRFFVITDFPNYLIFYRICPGGVEIVRVLHGARNIPEIFE